MAKVADGGVTVIAAMALKAQQARMRIIAENIANADSTGQRARNLTGGKCQSSNR